MKKIKELLFASKKVTVMFIASALLVVGGIVPAAAQITLTSNTYEGTIQQTNIAVDLYGITDSKLQYNDADILNQTNGRLLLGHAYDIKLGVQNTGSIDTYTRVIVTKSWKNTDGTKNTTLDPSLITLKYDESNWKVVEDSSERTILYYTGNKGVLASESNPVDFATSVTLDESVASIVLNAGTATTWVYEGVNFDVDAEVQSVQTHNAYDAIKSAWGINPTEVYGITPEVTE